MRFLASPDNVLIVATMDGVPVQNRAASLDELLLVERHHAEALRAESVVPAVEVHLDQA